MRFNRLRAAAIILVSALASALASAVASPAHAAAFGSDADLVAAVMPACVDISVRGMQTSTDTASSVAPNPVLIVRDEVGSGVIVDPSGLILTNRHVVAGAYSVSVTLSDGSQHPASLVGEGLTFDIAILKIDVGKPLAAAKLGDSRTLRIGDKVVAIGNPQGFAGSASAGIVSALHRNLGLSAYDDLIQTDAAINRGNSGGPLFNADGEVIGINQAIYSLDQGSMGLGFAIPAHQVRFLLANLKQYGTPRIGWLGVTAQTFTTGMANALGVEPGGVILSALTPGAPAQLAGLAVSDILRTLDGEPLADINALNDKVAQRADRTVTIDLLRAGKPLSIPVALKEWPKALWSSALAPAPVVRDLRELGLTFRDTAAGGDPTVVTVADKSIAWRAGVRPGDIVRRVQGRVIGSMAHVLQAFEDLRSLGKRSALVLLGGPNGERWINFSIAE